MGNESHRLISLPNRTYQAVARSEIKRMAGVVGFDAKRMGELEIIIAEVTSNIVKHTTNGGELLVKVLNGDNCGMEIIAIDNGPGVSNISRMLEDGVSSTNTLGQGLGAIRRLADEFDIYSIKGWGTVLLARIFKERNAVNKKKNIEAGIIMVAKEGETECGDNYHFFIRGNQLKFAISDGLGHGKNAAIAAKESLLHFTRNIMLPPNEQIKRIHEGIKKTRGAVMNITHIDLTNKQVIYCGVGNIASRVHSAAKYKSCISYNGIVGHSIPTTLNNHVMSWNKHDLLIIHSDGLSSRWDLQKYPSVTLRDRSIIAAVLYKDFYRKTDDVTIAVISQHNSKA
jgi:anti-sigma regulatory factor (Ser/Thr protein kinase)